jgi:hypothetical protein
MQRIIMRQAKVVLGVLGTLMLTAGIGWAANPHFVGKVTATLNADGSLTVSWKEAGLGDNQNIDYVASAVASATFNCVNNGGQCPNAANKTTVEGPVSAPGTFNSGKNGQITASLTIQPPGAGEFTCPSGQALTLSEISYTGITITDNTNGIYEVATPSSLSAVLFECP